MVAVVIQQYGCTLCGRTVHLRDREVNFMLCIMYHSNNMFTTEMYVYSLGQNY